MHTKGTLQLINWKLTNQHPVKHVCNQRPVRPRKNLTLKRQKLLQSAQLIQHAAEQLFVNPDSHPQHLLTHVCLIPCSAQWVGLHATQQPLPSQQPQVRPPDLSSYGDGLVWGAALLLHSLGQTAHFKLTDLTTLLLESHQLGWCSTGVHLTCTPTADLCLSWSMSSHHCIFAAFWCLTVRNVLSQLHVCSALLSVVQQCESTIVRNENAVDFIRLCIIMT